MSKKLTFTGNFGEYFIMSLGLLLLSIITFGLASPYWSFWSFKYFFTKLEVDGKKINFTGGFWEYFILSLGLILLSVVTFGLALPYLVFRSVKYFFNHLEIQE